MLCRLHIEEIIWTISTGKCKYSVIFSQPIVQLSTAWINQYINLEPLDMDEVTEATLYRFLAVLFHSHMCSVSIEMAIESLRRLGKNVPPLETVQF